MITISPTSQSGQKNKKKTLLFIVGSLWPKEA
jgi:hypothetical protein